MGQFIAYGVWTRISKIYLPDIQNSDSSTPLIRSTEVEQALNENAEVIAYGFSPDQTIFLWASEFDAEQYYDIFTPSDSIPHSLPASNSNEYLVLEQSAHCWGVSGNLADFDPNDFAVRWQHMVMPSGTPAIFGQPSFADEPISLVWPPYRYFEDIEADPANIYGVYDGLVERANDPLGRSIAVEYPDVGYKITDWRKSPRVQTVWRSLRGGWDAVELKVAQDPPWTLPEGSFPVHPQTAALRERLDLLYAELLKFGIFGEDLRQRHCSFEVFEHLEKQMAELGPVLGITSPKQAPVCWSNTYSEEEDALRDDALYELYDPDHNVEDMPDRTREDVMMPLEPERSASIYIEAGPSATLTEEAVAERIIRLAPAAQLKTSWTGNTNDAIVVRIMD